MRGDVGRGRLPGGYGRGSAEAAGEHAPRTGGDGPRPGFGRDDRRGFGPGAGRGGGRGDRAPGGRSGAPRSGERAWAPRGGGSLHERPERAPRADRPADPFVPDDVEFNQLDREVRGRLRTLSKEQAERAGKHLVMVARLIDTDPELAYLHAQAAVRHAGRVDVAHEAAGLAAYRSGRYAEALRELRTVRRLNGSPEHLPVIADAERGLGRPERAIVVGNDPEAGLLSPESQVELAMVISGARLDLGEPEAAVAVLDSAVVRDARGLLAARVAQARATALIALGRAADADRELSRFTQEELDAAAGDVEDEDDEVFVFDLLEEADEDGGPAGDEDGGPAGDEDGGPAGDEDGGPAGDEAPAQDGDEVDRSDEAVEAAQDAVQESDERPGEEGVTP